MKPPAERNLVIFLLALLGAGAMYGGFILMISPSGRIFRMPLGLLVHSPFKNFLIPGIVLFSLLGIVPMVTIFALVKRPACFCAAYFNCFADMYWGWTLCIYTGFILMTWIQAEMILLRVVHWSHTLYMGLAMVIVFVALLPRLRNFYTIKS